LAGVSRNLLALELAAELLETFTDGVWLVELAAIRDPGLVAPTIAAALGIKESGRQPLIEALRAFLRPKQLLLVLDNFEQVGAAAGLVADLPRAAPGLKILATSRVGLGVYGERVLRVPSLALPADKQPLPRDELARYDAVRLFVERAQAAKADFIWAEERGQVDLGLRLAASLRRFWLLHGHLGEGRRWLETFLAQSRDAGGTPPSIRVKALAAAGNLAANQQDYAQAAMLYEQSPALYQALGDKQGVAGSLYELGRLPGDQRDIRQRQAFVEMALALFREAGDTTGIVDAFFLLSDLALEQGDGERSLALLDESVALARAARDKWLIGIALDVLAGRVNEQDDRPRAIALYEESIAFFRAVGEQEDLAWALDSLADLVAVSGATARAAALYEESLAIFRELGHKDALTRVLHKLGQATATET
jgi:tetratricopeptide (TPR) repeat protein